MPGELSYLPVETATGFESLSSNLPPAPVTSSFQEESFNLMGLPMELRFKIYHLSFFSPQILLIHQRNLSLNEPRGLRLPLGLQINREIRNEAIKHFTRWELSTDARIKIKNCPYIYINTTTDYLEIQRLSQWAFTNYAIDVVRALEPCIQLSKLSIIIQDNSTCDLETLLLVLQHRKGFRDVKRILHELQVAEVILLVRNTKNKDIVDVERQLKATLDQRQKDALFHTLQEESENLPEPVDDCFSGPVRIGNRVGVRLKRAV
ncbi:hypothetical protein GLAREA_00966 [Glarea lozoyensis ATCC 20868]|uniref:2EXR domain-containing protein n=1 Tax=Glarea lozoyensis (strain ATCC 20868 / MF5171) TaxID=1116229 RepID=S3DCW1_GLAL2|nr:uncharacterized protein GLAREA_00966 [Glarea lozoyensis ATCC 20868]EPE29806.1 hypothetical protein GLAREA_00966 [Glarea lozoyensis ATCC 20868]